MYTLFENKILKRDFNICLKNTQKSKQKYHPQRYGNFNPRWGREFRKILSQRMPTRRKRNLYENCHPSSYYGLGWACYVDGIWKK
jgi:hypothetical protein